MGEKDMGGWIAAVFTEEQQTRLGVDEMGRSSARARSTANGRSARIGSVYGYK